MRLLPRPVRRTLRKLVSGLQIRARRPVFQNYGHCPCCQLDGWFSADDAWFRDHYRCQWCESIPRERALMWVIEHFRPTFRTDVVHESSPASRGASVRLAAECVNYTAKEEATKGGVLSDAIGSQGGSVRIEKMRGGYQEERTFPRSEDPRESKG